MTDVPMFAAPPPLLLKLSKALVTHKLGKDEKVSYTRYTAKARAQCGECVAVLHEAGGKGWSIGAATVSRKEGSGGRLLLCGPHGQLWKQLDGVDAKPKRARGRGRR